jgi:hypothetical protein
MTSNYNIQKDTGIRAGVEPNTPAKAMDKAPFVRILT